MPGSRISNTGQPQARNDATLDTARSGSSVTENGITVGEWLCTTAIDVRPRLEGLAVDEALQEHAAVFAGRPDWSRGRAP